jgi:hypothetical protein
MGRTQTNEFGFSVDWRYESLTDFQLTYFPIRDKL